MQSKFNQWVIPAILVAGAGAVAWFYWARLSQQTMQTVTLSEPQIEVPAELPGPLHPLESVAGPRTDREELVPLPPLDRSDDYLKIEAAGIFGDSINGILAESGLIERMVATIDNLPRSHVSERIRPVGGLDTPFLVDGQDGSGEYFISVDNSRRYAALVEMVEAADLDALTDLYRRYYPLFQDAYASLGYPDAYFNDRLVEVIDHLLATPEVSGPIELVRPHVMYEYSDPDLEALSSGQKLLLRMGSENASQIKRTLSELRQRITAL
jgi:hypothetical protein